MRAGSSIVTYQSCHLTAPGYMYWNGFDTLHEAEKDQPLAEI